MNRNSPLWNASLAAVPQPRLSPLAAARDAETAGMRKDEHNCVHGLLEEVLAKVRIQFRDNDSDEACEILNGLQELKAIAAKGAA